MRTGTIWSTLRSTFSVIWSVSDRFVVPRLASSLALLVLGSAISALVPVLLAEVINSLNSSTAAGGSITPALLISAFVLFQLLLNVSTALRQFIHGTAS